MSKRLQVLLSPQEYGQFQKMAQETGLSLGEWVRQALRRTASFVSRKSPGAKIAAIRRAAKHNAPTADIEQMLAEIEKGYLS